MKLTLCDDGYPENRSTWRETHFEVSKDWDPEIVKGVLTRLQGSIWSMPTTPGAIQFGICAWPEAVLLDTSGWRVLIPGADRAKDNIHFEVPCWVFARLAAAVSNLNKALAEEMASQLPAAVDEAIENLDCGCDKSTMKKIAAAVLAAAKKGKKQ